MSSFFSPNTHSKNVLCRDDTIHAIKFPCYDLTYSNAASGLYSACIFNWKLLCASRLLKNIYEHVCDWPDQHICVCAEVASKVSNIFVFAIE